MTSPELLDYAEAFFKRGVEIMVKKNHDYSSTADAHSNFRTESITNTSVVQNITYEITKKCSRLNQIANKGALVDDESFMDTCVDIANYAALLASSHEQGKRT